MAKGEMKTPLHRLYVFIETRLVWPISEVFCAWLRRRVQPMIATHSIESLIHRLRLNE